MANQPPDAGPVSWSDPQPPPAAPMPQYSADYGYPGAPGPAPGLLYARFWRRFLGYVIDTVLVGVATSVISFPLVYGPYIDALRASFVTQGGVTRQVRQVSITDSVPLNTLLLVSVVLAIVGALYFGVLVASWGKTPGQAAVGVRVVRQEDVSQRLPLPRALARAVPWWGGGLLGFTPTLSTVVGLATLLALLWVAWDPEKQGLHDKLGRALVVKNAPQLLMAPYGYAYPQQGPGPT